MIQSELLSASAEPKSPQSDQLQSQIPISHLLSDNPRNSANSVIEMIEVPMSRQTTGDSTFSTLSQTTDSQSDTLMPVDSPQLPSIDSFDTRPVGSAETAADSASAGNNQSVLQLPFPLPPNSEPIEFNPRKFDYSQILSEERDHKLFAAMQIDEKHFFSVLFGPAESALNRFMTTAPQLTQGHKSVVHFKLTDDIAISCVNWKDRCFITGTDVVRLLVHKYQHFTGMPPRHMKKFEEGIFSDLRRLTPPNDCVLEGTRSDFLVFLFDIDCVRSKKKQKVFFWDRFKAMAHNIFCDAVDRELARVQMARAVGMSVDEFIKSGVVPTGTISHHDPLRQALSQDWPEKSLQMDEAASIAAGGYMKVDQIHIIRNDISQLFSRLLRVPVFDPSHTPAEKEYLVVSYLNTHMFRGVFTPPKPVPPTPQPTPRQRAREAAQAMYLDDDDDIESSPPQHTVGSARKTARRRGAPSKQSAPPTPKASSRATPPTSFRYTPAGRRSQLSHLFASRMRDDDDEYSVSTISSNDDEYRMQYEYPTYIDHSYDDDYSTSTQMPLYLSGRMYTPQPEVSSFVRHVGSPHIPSSPMSIPDLMSCRISPKRMSEEYHIPAPKHSKRSHLLEDADMNDLELPIAAATGEAEAAYILLGISRSH